MGTSDNKHKNFKEVYHGKITHGKYLIVHCSYLPLKIYARRKIEERIKEMMKFEYPYTPEELMQMLHKGPQCNILLCLW